MVFTILVPLVVAVVVPRTIDSAHLQAGLWRAGWLLVIAGAAVYCICLLDFLAAGGTPAIFFTRPIRFLIGEEPASIVRQGLYRHSRNPMYLGVLAVVFGQAIVSASLRVAVYGLGSWFLFHLVVVFLEEPHLRATRGASYDEYCRKTPRWLGPTQNVTEPRP
jgi:protein-S-isoprenylcysteine O-methyltransferase Ste14